ncbi:MAG: hypothetical protein ACT4PE_09965 [Candidatus Eiseniibacteriota bacterium]
MRHPTQEDLITFAAGRTSPAEAEGLFSHLDGCGACAQRYAAVRRIRSDFEGSWSGFVDEMTARMAPVPGAMDVVVRGMLDGAKRLATAALDRVAETAHGLGGFEAAFRPAYGGVGAPGDEGEAARLAERASAHCASGDERAALAALEEAGRLDARTSAVARLDLRIGGRKVGEVVVDARRRSISVIVDEGKPGGEVVLITGKDAPERTARLEAVEGASHFLAEFEDVTAGWFSLRLRVPE